MINLSSANREVQRFVVETLMQAYFDMQDPDMVEFIYRTANEASCEPPQQLSWELKEYIEQTKEVQPGKKAPEIILKDQAGKEQLLSTTAKTHKQTIVFFWASWCPHCLNILPELQLLYPELKSNGVEVFAVALDDNYEDWVLTLAEHNTPWVNVSERKKWDTQAVSDYNVRTTPTLFLLSSDMTIVGKYSMLEDLIKALSLP